MEKLTVKIARSDATTWYAHHVGQTYEVYRFGSRLVLVDDYDRGSQVTWRYIEASDAEVI